MLKDGSLLIAAQAEELISSYPEILQMVSVNYAHSQYFRKLPKINSFEEFTLLTACVIHINSQGVIKNILYLSDICP